MASKVRNGRITFTRASAKYDTRLLIVGIATSSAARARGMGTSDEIVALPVNPVKPDEVHPAPSRWLSRKHRCRRRGVVRAAAMGRR